MSPHEPLGKNLSVKKLNMFDITYIIFIFANISSTRFLPENLLIMSPKSGVFAHHEPSRGLMMAHDVQFPKASPMTVMLTMSPMHGGDG